MGRRLQRFLRSEQFESRRPLAADLAALDVNDDMKVTALDALVVINAINQRAAGNVTVAEAEGHLNCDTNSDGVVSPLDVLNVVNQINTGVISVPVDTTDTSVTSAVESVPVDSTDDPVDETSPEDDVTDTSPDDSDLDDGSDTSDGSDETDESDETDGSDETDDEDVVSDPTDGSDDDTSEDDTSEDDSTDDDDTSNDDSNNDDTGCEHGHDQPITAIIDRVLTTIRTHHGRGNLFDDLDANDDGALSSDEVPAQLWDRISEADADDSGSVTQAELNTYRDAQLEARRRAAVEAFFERLDSDDSGSITSADVSRLAWHFLSRADANNDGSITVEELMSVPLPGRIGGH